MTSNIYKKIFLLLIFTVSINFILNSQTKKFDLSRQDSAEINILLKKSQEYADGKFFKEQSDCYNKIADIWWEHNYFTKASEYYLKSLEINKKLANANGIAMINSNLALIYADKGDYKKSLEYFDKTLSIRKSRKEKVGIIAAHINISVVLNNLKRYDESVQHLTEALDIAREMNDYTQMRSCYGMLSETYEKAGNLEKSMYYFQLYKKFNELVEGKKVEKAYNYAREQELKRKLAEKENQIKELELIKKDYEIIKTKKNLKKTENEKLSLLDTISEKELKLRYLENQKKLEEAKNKELMLKSKLLLRNIIFVISTILLILFVVIFFYIQKRKSNKILLTKNAEISQKNEEIQVQKNNIEELLIKTTEAHESIKKSIDYASYIQSAMINKTPKLSEFLPESFILYKPKDVVGGDFYWYSKIKDKIIVAAVDCTGHGVPGAFLTVLGNNILNQIVNINKTTEPGSILQEMNNYVKEALNQSNSDNKDGMDIALCTIDLKNKKLQFAGANNPLILIQNKKMNVIKGEKYGIAGFSEILYGIKRKKEEKTGMYKTHEFVLTSDTCIYLFSDGFYDQIGGKGDKKLKSINFYNLLYEKHEKNASEQKKELKKFFNEWKNENEQVDDIVVIGIKFNKTLI